MLFNVPALPEQARPCNFLRPLLLALVLVVRPAIPASGNTSGIATTGVPVTVKDNGDGTVTMANGIVSIRIETAANRLNSIVYTANNSGTPRAIETLQGREHFRWGGFPLGGSAFVYSLSVDPATNGGSYADVMLLNTSNNKGVFEVHYSMLRGSSGFYATGTLTHRAQDAAGAIGAWGALIWVPADFDWVSLNARHNYWVGPAPARAHGIRVPDSAHELTVLLSGGHAGEFDDKFMYAEDRANLSAWGWSSVGPSGLNIGAWMMSPMEYSDGGTAQARRGDRHADRWPALRLLSAGHQCRGDQRAIRDGHRRARASAARRRPGRADRHMGQDPQRRRHQVELVARTWRGRLRYLPCQRDGCLLLMAKEFRDHSGGNDLH